MEKIGLAAVLDMDDFNRNMAKYDSALGQMDKTTDAAAKKVGLHFGGIGTAVENVALLIAGAFVGIGASIGATAVEGLKSFAGFEKGMNEVFTLLPGVTKTAMEKMTNDVQAFNKKFGTLSEESVPALYQALSAGVPPGNVFDFLEVAQKAALGGVSTLETAVDGLTSVTNAYGQDVISTGEASDLMFTTVRLGKTTFDELSKSLFNVVPVAAGLGIEFGEVTAALSSMTKQGVPTSVATTQLRQLFVELSKSGSAVSDTFTTLSGTSFRDFIAGGGDVQKALQILEQGAQDTGVGISDLFGSVEAGSAALILTGKGTAVFSSDLAAMDKSAGATQAAFETMDKGIFRSIDKIKSSFQVMMQDVGEKLAPVFAQLANWVQTNMPAVETTVVGVFSSIADWAMAKLPGALQALQDAFNYVRDVVIPLAKEHFSAFVSKMEEVRDVLIPLAKEQLANFILKAQELWDMIAPMIVTIGGWVTAFANMDSGQRDLILTFAAVILAVGPVVSAISGLSAIIGGIVAVGGGAVTALTGAGGVAASLLGLLTPVGWVVAAVAGLALAWATDFGGIRTGTIAQVEYIGGLLAEFGESVKTKIETGIENAKTAWNTGWDNISGKVATVAVTIGEAVTTFGGNVKTAISTAIDNTRTYWGDTWDSISGKATEIAGNIETAVTTFGGNVKTVISTAIDNARTAWNTTWDNISSKVSTIAGTIGTALSTFGESVKSKVQTGIDNARTAWNTGWDNISSKVSTIAGTIGTALSTFGESVKTKVDIGINNAKTAWTTTWDSISGKVSTIAGTIGSAVSSLGGNVKSALSTTMNSALDSWGIAWDNVKSTINNKAFSIAAAARSAGSGAVDTLRSGWESGTSSFGRAVQNVAGSISGYFEEKSNHWLTAGRNVIEGVSTGISNRSSGLYAQMQTVASNVLSTFKSALGIRSPSELFAEAGYNISAGLAQGITEGQGLVSEAMARLESQTQLELNQYSAMVDKNLAATIQRYQQGLAQGQAQDAIRQGFSQNQYAAYWAAIQAGENEASAIAKGQAVAPTVSGGATTPAATPVVPTPPVWSAGSGEPLPAQYQSEQEKIFEEMYGFLRDIGWSREDIAGDVTMSGQGQSGSIIENLLAALGGVRDVMTGELSSAEVVSAVPDLVKELETLNRLNTHGQVGSGQAALSVDLRTKISELITTLTEAGKKASESIKSTIATSSLGALLGKFGGQRQLSQSEIDARKVVARADIDPQMIAVEQKIAQINQQMQEFNNEYDAQRNLLLSQNLTQQEVQAALNDWMQATGSQLKAATLFSELRNANDQRKGLDALLAERMAQIDAESVVMPTPDVLGITKILQGFAASTLGVGVTDFMSALGNKFSNLYGGIEQRLGNAAYFGIDTGGLQQSAIVEAAKTLFTAGGETIFSTIDNALTTLLSYRNVAAAASLENTNNQTDGGWGAPQLTAAISDIASALRQMQSGTTFNVAFQGSAGANADVMSDIQFLNSLYGGT